MACAWFISWSFYNFFSGMSWYFKRFQSAVVLILSKAFSKSTKPVYRKVLNYNNCSIILRIMAIKSVHDRLLLKQACSSRRCWSSDVLIFSSIILFRTLLVTNPCFQSFGTFSSSQILPNRCIMLLMSLGLL